MILDRLVPYIFLTGGLLIGASIFWYLRLWERGDEGRWDGPRPADRGVEPAAAPRRLPRLFLIGFILCVLTGPLVLWMLIQGGAPAGPRAQPDAIEAFLDRLPDASTQAGRHAELIDAIRGLRLPAAAPPTLAPALGAAPGPLRVRARWQWPPAPAALAAVGALLVLAAGVIVIVRGSGPGGRTLGIGIGIVALAVLASAGPDLMTFTLEGPPAAAGPPARLVHVARLGPFPDAGHTLAPEQVAAALEVLRRTVDPADAGFLLVVGHVDARPLAGAARAAYGTDAGLAQARANWVRARLLDLAGEELRPERVLALPAGPASAGLPGATPPATEAGGDRSVDLYAFGTPRRSP